MIKIEINEPICKAEIGGLPKSVAAEAILANICITEAVAKALHLSFDNAALFIMQQSALAHKQTEQHE